MKLQDIYIAARNFLFNAIAYKFSVNDEIKYALSGIRGGASYTTKIVSRIVADEYNGFEMDDLRKMKLKKTLESLRGFA